MKKRNYLLSKEEERNLHDKLFSEWTSGAWTSNREAAVRHGVPESVVGRILRRIKDELGEITKENRKDEVARTLAQIEEQIGRALRAFDESRRKRLRCRKCKGLGEGEQGNDCPECDGEGYLTISLPGDPRWLGVVQKALEQKAKIYAMFPKSDSYMQNLNVFQPEGGRNPLLQASSEQILVAKRLLEDLQPRVESVVDVEFSEGGKGEKGE